MNHIVLGVILVVGVLMLFLGLRNALFVGLAIPMSMFISFTLLNAFGVTLNMMVLFALILALGRLVDDGIVIVENIHRHMTNGEPAMKATRLAVGEVTMPIIAATTATVMVFVPLLFWPGMMGEFMKYLPITFMIALGLIAIRGTRGEPCARLQIHEGGRGTHMPVKRMWRAVDHPRGGCHHRRHRWQYRQPGHLRHRHAHHLLRHHGSGQQEALRTRRRLVPVQVAARLEARYEGFLRYALDKHHPRTFLLRHLRVLIFSFVAAGRVPAEDPVLPRERTAVHQRLHRSAHRHRHPQDRQHHPYGGAQVMKVIDVPDYKEVREIKDANGNVIGTET
jgi:hypothetical protein